MTEPDLDEPANESELDDAAPKTVGKRGYKRLLNLQQHQIAARMYITEQQPPREICRVLLEKTGAEFKPLQISEYARARGWTKRKQKAAQRVTVFTPEDEEKVAVQSHQAAKIIKNDEHKQFLEDSARVALTGLSKAESMLKKATDVRSLSTAMTAAKTSIEIYRKSVGLEDSAVARPQVFHLHVAKLTGSPFLKREKQVQETPAVAIEAAAT